MPTGIRKNSEIKSGRAGCRGHGPFAGISLVAGVAQAAWALPGLDELFSTRIARLVHAKCPSFLIQILVITSPVRRIGKTITKTPIEILPRIRRYEMRGIAVGPVFSTRWLHKDIAGAPFHGGCRPAAARLPEANNKIRK